MSNTYRRLQAKKNNNNCSFNTTFAYKDSQRIPDWPMLQMIYAHQYNLNRAKWEDPHYTFFADMMIYFKYPNTKKNINSKIDDYVKNALEEYCLIKHDDHRNAFCCMIESLMLIARSAWQLNDNDVDEVSMHVDDIRYKLLNDYSKYVTEDELGDILHELD